ncbi:Esterase FE4 [Frankliniella fusca]|uniref:Carboxylic ester hydrolase n=1 Tax=Frankliniella fusca TaxID=407009 RepID=A0AAE1LHF3_9NEOP|nr:Esterase FE4 [Frankliniella fusca]
MINPSSIAVVLGFLLCGIPRETQAVPLPEQEAAAPAGPVVTIAQGKLTGVVQTSAGGNKFLAYYGIPYAKPPVGDLRFKDPEPADAWEGVYAARTEGNICPQPMKPMKRFAGAAKKLMGLAKTLGSLPNIGAFAAKHMTRMKEDCLFLNVYTPTLEVVCASPKLQPPDISPSEQNLLPVLVFFHGGAFSLGSADAMMYGADFLMDKGIVLVTVNYRLGPLGFLATNTSDAPGNAGVKDQRLALRWVRDNIKAFGGDPARVTLYGESAGAYSAHVHVLSPGSAGLFRAAIMSSSMAPNLYGFQENPDAVSRRLAEALGADAAAVEDPAKRVAFLRSVPVRDLFHKMMGAVRDEEIRSLSLPFPWALVAEPADTPDAVLTGHPNDLLRKGEFNRVPLMVGMNNQEGSLIVPMLTDAELQDIAEHPVRFVPDHMQGRLDEGGRTGLAKDISDLYFKGRNVSRDTVPELIELFGDEVLAHGISVGARWHAKHATPEAPLYLYLFAMDAFGAVSTLLGAEKVVKGAGHADDLGYVFRPHLLDGLPVPDQDKLDRGRSRMTAIISDFVKDRNPTPSKTVADVALEWPAATADSIKYLEIGDELVVKDGIPFSERMAFWDKKGKEVLQDPIYDV